MKLPKKGIDQKLPKKGICKMQLLFKTAQATMQTINFFGAIEIKRFLVHDYASQNQSQTSLFDLQFAHPFDLNTS